MKVIYFMDVLCGWCYAISENVAKIAEDMKDEFEFIVNPGGMVKEGELKMSMMKEFGLLSASSGVAQATGVEVGEGYKALLKEYGREIDSIKASKAIIAFQELLPKKAVEFSKDIQHSYFVDGIDPSDEENLVKLAENLGVDKDDFLEKLNSEDIEKKTEESFKKVFDWRVELYPSLYLYEESTGKYKFLMNTKGTYEEIKEILEKEGKSID